VLILDYLAGIALLEEIDYRNVLFMLMTVLSPLGVSMAARSIFPRSAVKLTLKNYYYANHSVLYGWVAATLVLYVCQTAAVWFAEG
jgi:hypothetical protein